MKTLLKTSLPVCLAAFIGLLLSACGPSGDTDGLKQNVQKSQYNIISLLIRPKYTTTISPLTSAPANPKYYFDHNDSEQLEAVGITDGGDEIILDNAIWSLTDNTATAGASSISRSGLLSMESLAANQSKDITVSISFATLSASADIVISSYPLATNGLSIKIAGTVVNSTSQTVVVCDTKTLTVEGLFDDGSTRDVTSKINWSSAINDSNASFNTGNPNQAVFSAHTNATYTVTPSYKSQGSATVDLVVAQTGFSDLQLSSSTVSISVGETQAITATANIDSGSGKLSTDVSQRAKWASADTSIFTVNSSGTIKGIAKGGPTNLTATCGTEAVTASVSVDQDNTIKSIEILDSDFSSLDVKELAVNETVNLKLRLHRTDGSTEDITTDTNTTWAVVDIPNEDESITVNNTDNKGLVTATAIGRDEVVATYKTSYTPAKLLVIVK